MFASLAGVLAQATPPKSESSELLSGAWVIGLVAIGLMVMAIWWVKRQV